MVSKFLAAVLKQVGYGISKFCGALKQGRLARSIEMFVVSIEKLLDIE